MVSWIGITDQRLVDQISIRNLRLVGQIDIIDKIFNSSKEREVEEDEVEEMSEMIKEDREEVEEEVHGMWRLCQQSK